MKNHYEPHPEDTSAIRLPDDITELIEILAKNVHEVWAESRLREGWTYGAERDDATKKHPCLVAYEDLPEIEKEYDRNTAMGTLRLILKHNFKITR